jgi:hypothetical protein
MMKKVFLFFALMLVIGFLQPVKSDSWPAPTTAQRLQEQANKELLDLQEKINSTCQEVVEKQPVIYDDMIKILDRVDYYEARQEWWDKALMTKYKIKTTVPPLSKDV